MKERPILYSAPMVSAILKDIKTQTRRVAKLSDLRRNPNSDPWYKEHIWSWRTRHGSWTDRTTTDILNDCPYGQPGDRLWVRESFRVGAWDPEEGLFAFDYRDGPVKRWRECPDPEAFNSMWISCCDELETKKIKPDESGDYHWLPGNSPLRWRPSIHMPRWASRITLEIVSVRIERLNDISEEDAFLEGTPGAWMEPDFGPPERNSNYPERPHLPSFFYKLLWEDINGKGSWEKNPWVWVIDFRKLPQEQT